MEYTNLIEIKQIYKGESRRFFTYGPYSQPIWGVSAWSRPFHASITELALSNGAVVDANPTRKPGNPSNSVPR